MVVVAMSCWVQLVERLMSELERGERKAGSRLVDLMLAAATQHGGQEGEAAMWSTEKMLAQCITCEEDHHQTTGTEGRCWLGRPACRAGLFA